MWLALALALASAGNTDEEPTRRLLVAPLQARPGVPADVARVMGDLLGAEAKKIPGFTALTHDDIQRLLEQETRNQLAGCDSPGCFVDVGRAVRADEILHGTVGRLGRDEWVITLTRLDASTARATGADAERLSGPSDDTTLDHVTLLLHRLYPAYTPPPARARGLNVFALLGLMGVVGATTQYAALASVIGAQIFLTWPPVHLVIASCAVAAFLVAPFYIAWIQAWLMDQFGKRQAGIRWAALAGFGVMSVASVLIFLPAAMGTVVSTIGAAMALPTIIRAIRAREPPSAVTSQLLLPLVSGGGVFAVGSVPGALMLVLGTPAAQALLLYFLGQPRPVDAEPVTPTLWSPQEKRPRWIPANLPQPILDHVVGGEPSAPVKAAEPAALKQP